MTMKGQPTGPFFGLTWLTLKGAVNEPVTLLISLLCVVGSTLVPLLQLTDFGETGKMARDGALALHLLLGTFLTAHLAARAIRQDSERGLAATILSKPVSPARLFLAKFTGIAMVTLIFSVLATLSALVSERIAERHEAGSEHFVVDTTLATLMLTMPILAFLAAALENRLYRVPFIPRAFQWLLLGSLLIPLAAGFLDRSGHISTFNLRMDTRILTASALITLALWVMTAMALTLATFCRTPMTLGAMTGILCMGLLWDYFFTGHTSDSFLLRMLSCLIPNWQFFWMPDALNAGGQIPDFYLGCAFVYAVLYTGAVLSLGVWLFNRRRAT